MFFKKMLAFHKHFAYNNTCVQENGLFRNRKHALLAQLVEHLTLNQGVQGSSP